MAHAQAVAEILARIVDADGDGWNLGPKYFAKIDDAERARVKLARRLARVSDHVLDEYLAKLRLYRSNDTCAFCMCPFQSLAHASIVGNKILHSSCAAEWTTWLDKAERETRYTVTPVGRAALSQQGAA